LLWNDSISELVPDSPDHVCFSAVCLYELHTIYRISELVSHGHTLKLFRPKHFRRIEYISELYTTHSLSKLVSSQHRNDLPHEVCGDIVSKFLFVWHWHAGELSDDLPTAVTHVYVSFQHCTPG
jgi:hypothetical protein